MAVKLFPPYVEGTIPAARWINNNKVQITVPFVMNPAVSDADYTGMALQIKSINNNRILGTIFSAAEKKFSFNEDQKSGTVIFNISRDKKPGLIETLQKNGNTFYKAQLAYSKNGNAGFYSTPTVFKLTQTPIVTVKEFDDKQAINIISDTVFNGQYTNSDPTERVYSYRFIIYNSDNEEYYNSGIQLHNSATQDKIENNILTSVDEHRVYTGFSEGEVYYLVYEVTTVNNITVRTKRLKFYERNYLDPELTGFLYADPDLENGQIKVYVQPVTKADEAVDKFNLGSGNFCITRASDSDNYESWQEMKRFKLLHSPISDIEFNDKTVEQGKRYKYAIQQYNDFVYSRKIYSNVYDADGLLYEVQDNGRLSLDGSSGKYTYADTLEQSQPVYCDFEHCYLFDANKQLKIKFNPQISSLKQNVLEQKLDTIGGQYPFVFRNGNVKYKEFQISGLISYHMDLEENFTSMLFDQDNYERGDGNKISSFLPTTQLTAENISMERQFRELVLDWLNNGELKCFKSPTEGNLIVRLTNISLTPNTTVGRMLWQFSATAYEMMEYNPKNLIELFYPDYYKPETIGKILPRSSSVLLDFGDLETITITAPGEGIFMDNVKIEGCYPGTVFQVGYSTSDKDLIIYRINGSGNANLGNGISYLIAQRPEKTLINKVGSVTFTYDSKLDNLFEEINKIEVFASLGNQISGENYLTNQTNTYGINYDNETLTLDTNSNNATKPPQLVLSDNILSNLQDIKKDFNKFLFIRAWKKQEVVIYRIKGVKDNEIEYYWDRNRSLPVNMENLPALDPKYYVYKIIYLSEDDIKEDPVFLTNSPRLWDCEYFFYNENGSTDFPDDWEIDGQQDNLLSDLEWIPDYSASLVYSWEDENITQQSKAYILSELYDPKSGLVLNEQDGGDLKLIYTPEKDYIDISNLSDLGPNTKLKISQGMYIDYAYEYTEKTYSWELQEVNQGKENNFDTYNRYQAYQTALADFYKNFEPNNEETVDSLKDDMINIKNKYNDLIGQADFAQDSHGEWVAGKNGKGLSMALFYFAALKGLSIPEDYKEYEWETYWDEICESIQRQDTGGVFD